MFLSLSLKSIHQKKKKIQIEINQDSSTDLWPVFREVGASVTMTTKSRLSSSEDWTSRWWSLKKKL